MSSSDVSREERIQARAYALWEEDGRPEGRSERHWHQARAEIESERSGPLAEGSAPAAGRKPNAKAKEPHPGMMGDGTEAQNLAQPGDPSARITEADVQDAFKAGS
jgi:hypothetical protein